MNRSCQRQADAEGGGRGAGVKNLSAGSTTRPPTSSPQGWPPTPISARFDVVVIEAPAACPSYCAHDWSTWTSRLRCPGLVADSNRRGSGRSSAGEAVDREEADIFEGSPSTGYRRSSLLEGVDHQDKAADPCLRLPFAPDCTDPRIPRLDTRRRSEPPRAPGSPASAAHCTTHRLPLTGPTGSTRRRDATTSSSARRRTRSTLGVAARTARQ